MAQEPRYNPYETPYESNYPSYEDRYAEPVDLDAFSSQLRSRHPARSLATREEFLPDDSVPLFLSDADGGPQSSRFGRTRKKRGSSRLLKTGALAVAATVAAFITVKNPLTVFANATASLIGISDVRSAPASVAPPRQAMAAVSASVPALATNATLPPSRDEIALALKTAHQTQAPAENQQLAVAAAPVAAAPVVAGPPVRRLDADELATLMTRAKALLAAGDILPARLLLERAAEAQEAGAALMLAQTYDPTVLGTQDIRNITPDPALARNWYQRAAQLGSADAQRRLSQLQ
jgi:hypothetical protein